MRSKAQRPRQSIYETITAKIVAAVEASPGNPIMPWQRGGVSPVLPTNAITGHAYRGVRLGIAAEPHPDYARYFHHWLKVMKADPRAIFAVAAKAQEAVNHLDGWQSATAQNAAVSCDRRQVAHHHSTPSGPAICHQVAAMAAR